MSGEKKRDRRTDGWREVQTRADRQTDHQTDILVTYGRPKSEVYGQMSERNNIMRRRKRRRRRRKSKKKEVKVNEEEEIIEQGRIHGISRS